MLVIMMVDKVSEKQIFTRLISQKKSSCPFVLPLLVKDSKKMMKQMKMIKM